MRKFLILALILCLVLPLTLRADEGIYTLSGGGGGGDTTSSYIIAGGTDSQLPNAVPLGNLSNGVLKNTGGTLGICANLSDTSYLPLSGGSLTGALTDSSGFNGPLTGNVTGTASGNLALSGGTLTGVLTDSSGFVGPLTGNVTGTASGNLALSGGTLTGALTDSSGFVGPLTGNVTGNVTGSVNATGGTCTVPTVSQSDNSNNAVDTAWAQTALANKVNITGTISMISPPGAPSGTPSTTGGSMATGTYYYELVAFNAYGNTVGGIQSSGISVTGPTGSVALTWTAVTGATSYNLYRTTTSGTYSGTNLIATGITRTSYTDTLATPTSGAPSTTDVFNLTTSMSGTLFVTTHAAVFYLPTGSQITIGSGTLPIQYTIDKNVQGSVTITPGTSDIICNSTGTSLVNNTSQLAVAQLILASSTSAPVNTWAIATTGNWNLGGNNNKRLAPTVTVSGSTGTLTPNLDLYDIFPVNITYTTAAATLTIATPTGTPYEGQLANLLIYSNNSQTNNLSWGSGWNTTTNNGTLPPTVASGKQLDILFKNSAGARNGGMMYMTSDTY
jgi:hypothetical protein